MIAPFDGGFDRRGRADATAAAEADKAGLAGLGAPVGRGGGGAKAIFEIIGVFRSEAASPRPLRFVVAAPTALAPAGPSPARRRMRIRPHGERRRRARGSGTPSAPDSARGSARAMSPAGRRRRFGRAASPTCPGNLARAVGEARARLIVGRRPRRYATAGRLGRRKRGRRRLAEAPRGHSRR